jgi:hypothetical protein
MKLLLPAVALLTLFSCQQRQYYTSSPEIDLVKKADAAYFAGDWESLRSCYADSSKTWVNAWHTQQEGVSIDKLINSYKTGLLSYESYKPENQEYEMVVNDKGEKWVHCDMVWIGKTKRGKEVRVPVHLTSMVTDNKIVYHKLYYDSFPLYSATQVSDSSQVNP